MAEFRQIHELLSGGKPPAFTAVQRKYYEMRIGINQAEEVPGFGRIVTADKLRVLI